MQRQVSARDKDAWGVMIGYDHFINPAGPSMDASA